MAHETMNAEALAANGAVGKAVVEHINSGASSDEPLWAAHYNANFESIEADGKSWKGLEKVREKHAEWFGMFTVHSCKAEGPYVTNEGFAVKMTMDVEPKDGSFPRMEMNEIGVYDVEGGRVIRERFFNPLMA